MCLFVLKRFAAKKHWTEILGRITDMLDKCILHLVNIMWLLFVVFLFFRHPHRRYYKILRPVTIRAWSPCHYWCILLNCFPSKKNCWFCIRALTSFVVWCNYVFVRRISCFVVLFMSVLVCCVFEFGLFQGWSIEMLFIDLKT